MPYRDQIVNVLFVERDIGYIEILKDDLITLTKDKNYQFKWSSIENLEEIYLNFNKFDVVYLNYPIDREKFKKIKELKDIIIVLFSIENNIVKKVLLTEGDTHTDIFCDKSKEIINNAIEQHVNILQLSILISSVNQELVETKEMIKDISSLIFKEAV